VFTVFSCSEPLCLLSSVVQNFCVYCLRLFRTFVFTVFSCSELLCLLSSFVQNFCVYCLQLFRTFVFTVFSCSGLLCLLSSFVQNFCLLSSVVQNFSQPCNENQLEALFILSLFRQSTSTCFGHICTPSSGGILYLYSIWPVGQPTVNRNARHVPTVV